MRYKLLLFLTASAVFFSCGQGNSGAQDTDKNAALQPPAKGQQQKPPTGKQVPYIYSQHAYADAAGGSLIIQNSFPKSGVHYTDPAGNKHIYAVFFTRILNNTASSFALSLHFPAMPAALSAAPGVHYRLLFPPDTLTTAKAAQYDYGFKNLQPFLDKALDKPSSLQLTVKPENETAFYVITLTDKGVNGPLRTGFRFKDGHAFYSIDTTEIDCGTYNLKLYEP